MACYQPLQKTDGKWHYTCTDGAGTYAVGHCSPWESCPECLKDQRKLVDFSGKDDCELCHGKRIIEKAEPCPGHDTPEEAIEHYRQYKIDNSTFDGKNPNQQEKCAVCGEWTQMFSRCPGTGIFHFPLCEKHLNREGLEIASRKKPDG